jgi:alginate O-acetyltransferase complex protein AlgI
MLFNSIEFILFFPIVTIGFYLLAQKFRWLWLLLASCIFYMVAVPEYILIILFTIIVDYFAGIFIEKSEGKQRKLFLIISLIVNITTLGLYKYARFIFDTYNLILYKLDYLNPYDIWNWAIPLGLSFHTFQAMSYTIEVYRGNQKAERHFGIYALYVMYYPQMVAGPIERPQNIIHQFYKKQSLKYQNVVDGLRLMAWGLIKKVVIADRLSQFVDVVYTNPNTDLRGIPLIIATLFFTIQIYCDFSGYSDIALGAAKTMGFDLIKNFNRPYFANTISDFWRRWHISLSTWFRDYLYIPLGGNRSSASKKYFNLLFVFLISGLWHGNTWCFVAWGGIHGFYQIFGQKTLSIRTSFIEKIGLARFPRIRNGINTITVFLLVSFAWIYFRAIHFDFAIYITKNLFVDLPQNFDFLKNPEYINQNIYLTKPKDEFYKSLFLIAGLFFIETTLKDLSINEFISKKSTFLRWSIYFLAVLIFIFLGIFDKPAEFIYFQF